MRGRIVSHQTLVRMSEPLPQIVGRKPVKEALERGDVPIEKVFALQGGRGLEDVVGAARAAGVPVQFVPMQRIDAMARGLTHQGVVALGSAVEYLDLHEMLDLVAPDYDAVLEKAPILVVFDGLEDPHNVGAVLRSAVAAGAAAAVVPARGMAPIGATAMKASAGLAPRIPTARVNSLVVALEAIKERGYAVVGAAGEDDAVGHTAFDWTQPVALVIGSEGSGLSKPTRKACDALVRIPMPGPAESLNASVAAGILLFEAVRQRKS